MKNQNKLLSFLILCLIAAGCSSTRGLKPGQVLYTGAEVKINPDTSAKIDDEKYVKSTLEGKTRPKPNKSILGFKYKLFFYNLAGEPKKPKGFKHWLRTKLGEPPVLLQDVKLKYNNDVLTSYLISQGYLQSVVTGDTIIKGKKGHAEYTADAGAQYQISSVRFDSTHGALSQAILESSKE
ncbi:MAG: hypothetical protein EOO92_09165, partial [Pedobacter sp.]